MNYIKIHNNIILNAKLEMRSKKCGIFEEHHIVMTSVGGLDIPENKVLLTPKEHYIIHLLLWKINRNYAYLAPLLFFKSKGSMCSRIYQTVRENHILHMKTNNPATRLCEESKKSKSHKLKNRVFSDDHRRKISVSRKGKASRLGSTWTDEQRIKTVDSMKKYHLENSASQETRDKISRANMGRKHSDESIEKQRKAAMNRKKYNCDICDKKFDAGNMTQHMKHKHGIIWVSI